MLGKCHRRLTEPHIQILTILRNISDTFTFLDRTSLSQIWNSHSGTVYCFNGLILDFYACLHRFLGTSVHLFVFLLLMYKPSSLAISHKRSTRICNPSSSLPLKLYHLRNLGLLDFHSFYVDPRIWEIFSHYCAVFYLF